MKEYFIETTNPEVISKEYDVAIKNGYTHFRAKGNLGYYGYNKISDVPIKINKDGSECQDLATDKIVLISDVIQAEVTAKNETQTDYKSEFEQLQIENSNIINELEKANNIVLEKTKQHEQHCKQITELEQKLKEYNCEILRLTDLFKKEENRVLLLDEFLSRGVCLPCGATMEIKINKCYQSAVDEDNNAQE